MLLFPQFAPPRCRLWLIGLVLFANPKEKIPRLTRESLFHTDQSDRVMRNPAFTPELQCDFTESSIDEIRSGTYPQSRLTVLGMGPCPGAFSISWWRFHSTVASCSTLRTADNLTPMLRALKRTIGRPMPFALSRATLGWMPHLSPKARIVKTRSS
jgi:hypothetical protein